MPLAFPRFRALGLLNRDGWLLFGTRFVRLFAYGLISVVLVLYLAELGFSDTKIGALLTLALVGDIGVSLWITTRADRIGRRAMLIIGATLMIAGGIAFAMADSFVVLLVAAIVAVISPSGGEVGPFLSIEQAGLSQLVAGARRTDVFAWYNLIGSIATACGALVGGIIVETARNFGWDAAAAYRPALLMYAVLGGVMAITFYCLSSVIEIENGDDDVRADEMPSLFGLHRSQGTVMRLSALFAMDAFGGGLIMQSILAYWLHVRFDLDVATLGSVFFAANLLAGVSALAAGWLAQRIGLVNTMVLTHLPSNLLLILLPLMPTAPWAVSVLLLRFSISQMDVPTRQAYVMAVVAPDERSAASGVTAVARSIGAALSPAIATRLIANPSLASIPFFLAGGIKILYDLLLWRAFASHVPEHELKPPLAAPPTNDSAPTSTPSAIDHFGVSK